MDNKYEPFPKLAVCECLRNLNSNQLVVASFKTIWASFSKMEQCDNNTDWQHPWKIVNLLCWRRYVLRELICLVTRTRSRAKCEPVVPPDVHHPYQCWDTWNKNHFCSNALPPFVIKQLVLDTRFYPRFFTIVSRQVWCRLTLEQTFTGSCSLPTIKINNNAHCQCWRLLILYDISRFQRRVTCQPNTLTRYVLIQRTLVR